MISRYLAALSLAVLAHSAIAADSASITLPGKRAYPESLTSTADGTIFAGNLAEGGVLRIRKGKVEPFILPGAFGTRSIEGVFADEESHTLWVCSNDYTQYGLTALGESASAVKGFDLATGKGKISLTLPGGPNECNDFAKDEAGALYVAETTGGRILRLAPGGAALEIWAEDPRFKEADGGPDGIALGGPGELYLNTYGGSHLFRIRIADGKPAKIDELGLSQPFFHADGLRRLDASHFVMVEGAGRLDLLAIEQDHVSVRELAKGLDEPAGVTVAGSRIWVSEARVSTIFDETKKNTPIPLPWLLRSFAMPSPLAPADKGKTQ